MARVRDLHKQRFELYVAHPSIVERAERVRRIQLEGLEKQVHWELRRAALTRASLMLIYASIVTLLLSPIVLGIALTWPPAEYVALSLFTLGLLVVLAFVVVSMLDVRQALRWTRSEHDRVATNTLRT